MSKSLPAYLQQVLEEQVAEDGGEVDDDTRDLLRRLASLNKSVERTKSQIMARRRAKQGIK